MRVNAVPTLAQVRLPSPKAHSPKDGHMQLNLDLVAVPRGGHQALAITESPAIRAEVTERMARAILAVSAAMLQAGKTTTTPLPSRNLESAPAETQEMQDE